MTAQEKSLLHIHISVFLFGFSALFARLVNQPSVIITLGRVFFSSITLFIFIRYYKINLRLDSRKDYFLIIISGTVLAVHWYCFIKSIQLSTVAIGTITFSSFPIFVSFLEPLVFREKIRARVVICSLVMLLGILIISPVYEFRESSKKIAGIIAGLVSGLSYAVLSLLNRNFSAKYRSEAVVFYEQTTAAVILLPVFFIIRPVLAPNDLFLLAILGIIFTAFAHRLFVNSLRHVKVSTAGIISGMEAVYSIILASLLLGEIPRPNEITGGLLVIAAAGYMTLTKG